MAAIHRAAQAAGNRCLDTQWLGCEHKYRFRCAHGHEWLRRGDNCATRPHCSRCMRAAKYNHENLDRLREVALERMGKCLSDEYLGMRAPYRFQCHHGHAWTADGKSVLKGNWCAVCRDLRLQPGPEGVPAPRKRRPPQRTASDQQTQREHLDHRKEHLFAAMQDLARARGGTCLSEQYIGARRYRWRCARGHEWMAVTKQVFAGAWCRQCEQEAWQERMQAKRSKPARILKKTMCLDQSPPDAE
ncbi:hypothetical protein AAW51_4047 [Caldimonas brevitalea]|uniref:Uncharacterized protein n=2 Tax=Caldimonas brevitalea TaxID=413882 RepID=A0A0G3BRX4_9BURK|nr:hypothetical protein AAW51_4047 [Caldimonas brevitalea]